MGRKNYNFYTLPNLEGDDVIGILATQHYKTNNVIISGDKDMRTIPTWHCFIGDDQLEFVDEKEADRNFVYKLNRRPSRWLQRLCRCWSR